MRMRLVSLLLTTVIMLSCFNVAVAEESYILSLADSIELALKDNPQLDSEDVKIQDAEKQRQEAVRKQKNQKGAIRLPEGLSLVAVKQGYYVSQAEINLNSTKKGKEQLIGKISYDVTNKYYTVKLAEALCESAEKAYNLATENKAGVDEQFKLGMVSQIEVDNAAYGVKQAKVNWDRSKREYDTAKRGLFIVLQIDNPNAELTLTDTIDFSKYASDINADIDTAMATRLDVYLLESALTQAVEYRRITEVLGYKSAEYSAANQTVVQSEYNCNNSKKMIALGIRTAYNDILNAEDSVLLAQENLSLKKNDYDVAKLQCEIGMITNSQLTAALNAVTTAEIELGNSKLAHKLAVIRYGYEITIGL